MDLELNGRKGIVTGGSRGIGKAVARELVREGADVVIAARTLDALETTATELASESGRTVLPIACDTASDDSVREMVARASAGLGGVDILVNCAAAPGGQARPPRLAEITDEHFWPDVNVKVMGYLRCIREVAPHMARRGGGRIVNVSGYAALRTGSTIGSMRNVAVAALTKNLADELGPLGISVNVVHPGLVRTEKTAGVVGRQAEARGVPEEEIEREMARGNVIGRVIEAAEIASVVAFLCSSRAVAINGDAVTLTGGAPGVIHY